MKKAVILAKYKTGLVKVPDPESKEDWVLVKVQSLWGWAVLSMPAFAEQDSRGL